MEGRNRGNVSPETYWRLDTKTSMCAPRMPELFFCGGTSQDHHTRGAAGILEDCSALVISSTQAQEGGLVVTLSVFLVGRQKKDIISSFSWAG